MADRVADYYEIDENTRTKTRFAAQTAVAALSFVVPVGAIGKIAQINKAGKLAQGLQKAANVAGKVYNALDKIDTAYQTAAGTVRAGAAALDGDIETAAQELAFAGLGAAKLAGGSAPKVSPVSPRLGFAAKAPKIAKNGETAATIAGKAAQKAYRASEVQDGVRVKEYRLPSRRKIDFVDFAKRKIYELKPNNSRAIRRGQNQLSEYRDEIEGLFGKGWKTVLDTY